MNTETTTIKVGMRFRYYDSEMCPTNYIVSEITDTSIAISTIPHGHKTYYSIRDAERMFSSREWMALGHVMDNTQEQLEIAEQKIQAYQELCKQIEIGINAINVCNDIAQIKEFARLMYKSLLFTEITIEEMDAVESEPVKPNRFAGCDRAEDLQGDR